MITVINLESLGVSEYDLPWQDVAELAGTVYGLRYAQIEQLSPSSDPPIGYVEWGNFSLPDENAGFAVAACRVRGQAVGAMTFRTLGEETGSFQERSYNILELGGTVDRDRQEPLARDVDFTAVAFSIEGVGLQLSALRLAVDRIQDWRR
jgi:hypothetical protein